MPSRSTLAEATAELAKLTGQTWTVRDLLEYCAQKLIPLQAKVSIAERDIVDVHRRQKNPPIWQNVVGDQMTFAVVQPMDIWMLKEDGRAAIKHPADGPRSWPVRNLPVTTDNVVVDAETLLKIHRTWQKEQLHDSHVRLYWSIVERRTLIKKMIKRATSDEYRQAEIDAAQAEQQVEDSKARLRRREETLENASATGIEKNVTDAENAVSSATVERDAAVRRMKAMRGDFPERVDTDALAMNGSSDSNGRVPGADTPPQSAPVSADTVAPPPAIEAAAAPPDAPVAALPHEPPAKRRTLWGVATPYLVETMRAGQYKNAKQLFNSLEAKAGPGSPFDKGAGDNRGSLFVREICEPMALKTLQNNWQKLMAEAAKK